MEHKPRHSLPRSPGVEPTVELFVLAAIFCDGIKGGVGKSWLARLIAYFLQVQKTPWAGIDGDPNNGHLVRFHPNETTHADATSDAGFDVILDAMGGPSQTSLLIDLPAGAGARLGSQMPALRAASVAADMRIVRVFVMESTFDSANQFKATSGLIQPQDTLVVLNNRSGKHDAFSFWKSSKTRSEFLENGGTEAAIGRLDENVVSFLEVNPMNRKLNFVDALSDERFRRSARYRLTPYLEEVVVELRRVFKLMELI